MRPLHQLHFEINSLEVFFSAIHCLNLVELYLWWIQRYIWGKIDQTSISKLFCIISVFYSLSGFITAARLTCDRSMNAHILFFVALAEVQVAVLSVLNLPRQGFLATCRIGHCCVCSPLLFAAEILAIRHAIRQRTVNRRWIKWAQGDCRVAWKPKLHNDVILNGVFRICLWLVARQLRIPNR